MAFAQFSICERNLYWAEVFSHELLPTIESELRHLRAAAVAISDCARPFASKWSSIFLFFEDHLIQ